VECYRSHTGSRDDLAGADARWPTFAPRARVGGSIRTRVPMLVRDLTGSTPRAISQTGRQLASGTSPLSQRSRVANCAVTRLGGWRLVSSAGSWSSSWPIRSGGAPLPAPRRRWPRPSDTGAPAAARCGSRSPPSRPATRSGSATSCFSNTSVDVLAAARTGSTASWTGPSVGIAKRRPREPCRRGWETRAREPACLHRSAQGPRGDTIKATALRSGGSLVPPSPAVPRRTRRRLRCQPVEPARDSPADPARPHRTVAVGRTRWSARGPVSADLIRKSRRRRCKPVTAWSPRRPGHQPQRFGLHSLWGRHSSGGLHSLQPQARWWWCLCRGGTQTFQMSPMVVSSR
jgi:hypothetical protein